MVTNSLADWLSAAPDEALAALLRYRRDMATPPPADSAVLATRAATPGSVARACEQLDRLTLSVLDAYLVLNADVTAVSVDALSTALGVDALEATQRLRERALAWGDNDGVRIVPTAREVSGQYPAGLGIVSTDLSEVDIRAALDNLPADELEILNKLSVGPPIGRTRDAFDVPLAEARTPIQRLLARKLLVARSSELVELPKQVGIALRGGHIFTASALTKPSLPTRQYDVTTVDAAAASESLEFLRHTELLINTWSETPPPILKSGGLGVRELRKLARELDVSESRAALIVELAVAAGLIGQGTTHSGKTAEWVPTTRADSWLASPHALRWIALVQAWLDLPRLPGLAGQRDDQEKLANPLSEELRSHVAVPARQRVLNALTELPPGTGITDPADLVAMLAWQAPRQGGGLRDELVRWCLTETAALGVVARGALTTATRALREGDRENAVTAMTEALPAAVDHILLQADLTIVVPGPLEPELAHDIAAVADIESSGHATVWRVTESSVIRALDSGRTADELHQLFTKRSTTEVPQSLTYLINDAARRHGRLRGGSVSTFLRCDDENLLTEVASSAAAAEYGLRKIAPTVLVSPMPLTVVISGLKAAGFTPVAEGPDGNIVDLRPAGRRIPARNHTRPPSPAVSQEISPDQLTALIAHIRAGDKAAHKRRGAQVSAPGGRGPDTATTLALLAQALREQREVWIGFVDSHGTALQRVVTPHYIGGGMLEGAEGERYPLHRITSAALVEE